MKTERVIKFRCFAEGKMWEPFELHKALKQDNGDGGNWHPEAIFLQWTGLHDKNGLEIYEGDVCRFKHREVERIEQVNYRSAAFHLGIYITLHEAFLTKYNEIQYSLEVIGNIYRNPELLK